MVKTKSERRLKRSWHADNKTVAGDGKETKRQFSAYEAPSLREFLLVLLAVAILIVFSWGSYYEFGWFH